MLEHGSSDPQAQQAALPFRQRRGPEREGGYRERLATQGGLHRAGHSLAGTVMLLAVRAVVYEEFGGALSVREVPDPEPPRDGVVIEVRANGICRSDWHGWMGHDPDIRLPHVPGHELAGCVAEVGPAVRRWKAGDRVTAPFAVGCGRCVQCQLGQFHICDDYYQPGFTGWGSFAQRVAIPHADLNLVRLPPELSDVAAASLGCRLITAYRAVVHQGRVQPGEWVVVHGCGGLGLAAIMVARTMGARTIGVDLKPGALECAIALGATHVLRAGTAADVPQTIRDLTAGGAHLSLDALGSPATCWNSVACLRKRGRHVQVGLLLAGDREPRLPMHLVVGRELEILGSHGMPATAYPALLDLIQSAKLDPARLVRKTVSLADAPAELMAMGEFHGTGVTVIDRFA